MSYKKQLIAVMIATPAILAPLLLLSIYFADILGNFGFPVVIMQIVLTTISFVVGMFLIGKIIVYVVKKS